MRAMLRKELLQQGPKDDEAERKGPGRTGSAARKHLQESRTEVAGRELGCRLQLHQLSAQTCLRGRAPSRAYPQSTGPRGKQASVLISIGSTRGSPGIIPGQAKKWIPPNHHLGRSV